MSSSITLAREVETVRRFIRRAPLTFTGTNEPAFTIGDWVRGFILAPPFAWRWNRATVPAFQISSGQDYQKHIPNFGWLEQATIIDSSNSAHQLEVVLNLGEEQTTNQPTKIAARLDDGNGNITFRVTPPPDQSYTLNITYQIACPVFKNINDTFAPIPDYFHNLVFQGVLAKALDYIGDERFPAAIQLFVRQVMAANGGLDQTQLNIFLSDHINSAVEQQSALQKADASNRSRSLS